MSPKTAKISLQCYNGPKSPSKMQNSNDNCTGENFWPSCQTINVLNIHILLTAADSSTASKSTNYSNKCATFTRISDS